MSCGAQAVPCAQNERLRLQVKDNDQSATIELLRRENKTLSEALTALPSQRTHNMNRERSLRRENERLVSVQ